MRPGLWAGLEVQKLPSLMPGKASACTGFAFATYCCSAVLRRPDYQSVIMQLVDPVLPRRAFALLSCPSVANEAHSSPSHALVLADACTKGKVCICWCVTAGSVPPAVMHHHCLSPSSPLNAHPQFLLSSTPWERSAGMRCHKHPHQHTCRQGPARMVLGATSHWTRVPCLLPLNAHTPCLHCCQPCTAIQLLLWQYPP